MKKKTKNVVKIQSKSKNEKSFIEPKYLKIKEYFKSKTYDPLILNEMCLELIEILGELTGRGINHIEGLPMDTWKMRVSVIVEKAGLLPEYHDEDEIELDEEIQDDWYNMNDEDDINYMSANIY